jgi:hypothetical protein
MVILMGVNINKILLMKHEILTAKNHTVNYVDILHSIITLFYIYFSYINSFVIFAQEFR